ncbi:hypothetical protein NEUTE1DRAFT_90560 [Neurospora tetrasperma FGSC 2508]|uniref:Uncharacterized protein n=1 Tax=Neurospora tetrasperma (strain FGSC 2508 / ATCC MYA-4615 / P0657) TaxID=510951 RepID=F8N1U1_NEUT8|nr:uncharacterized protein NEUTE1DRAFT_90560 [Neurospora tetrasperma FGSC 2508]EGO52368.1 hypothetical protein NEUTE1DRAFT_90560 [Neurospora tetrasperma FGSC 2508]
MPPTEDIQYAPPGSYLAYKRNSKLLLCWIVRTVQSIIKFWETTRQHDLNLTLLEVPSAGLPGQKRPKELLANPGRAGFFNRSRLYNFCRFISLHVDVIPPSILALFLHIIHTRVTALTTWQALAARRPRPEEMENFRTLETDIRAFWVAFNGLRGFHWMSTSPGEQEVSSILKYNTPETEEDINYLVPDRFPIRFHPEAEKGKPGRRNKSKTPEKEAKFNKIKDSLPPDDFPLSHFDIDDPCYTNGRFNSEGNAWGMAAYDLFKEFMHLRNFLHDTWVEVVFDGLNSTVAGAIGIAAMNLIVKYRHDNIPEELGYISMIDYLTGYQNPDDNVQPFFASVYRVHGDGSCSGKTENQSVDMKEQFMIYTFESLFEFLSDFRTTQTGKPTERMAKLLQSWDSSADLMVLTKEEYLQWRHLYTIKLLYSLFDEYVAPILKSKEFDGDWENVIWGPKGPSEDDLSGSGSYQHRAFLSSIIKLAMEKPSSTGESTRHNIQPTTVFILQHMVDSFTVSRGWMNNPLWGPIFVQPPSSDDFFPARDLALFLGVKLDDSMNLGPGFWTSLHLLDEDLRTGEDQKIEQTHFLKHAARVCSAALEFRSTRQDQGAGSNFLWGCSPFHCAEVLVQSLTNFDHISRVLYPGFTNEPVLLVHLVERIGRLENLQRFMEDTTAGEEKRAMQVKGHGSSNNHRFIIKGGRDRAKTIMEGIQAVDFKLNELVPGKLLEGPGGSKVVVNFRDVLELLKTEVIIGVHGSHCLDAVNRLWVTARSIILFHSIERQLAAAKDPLYLSIYGDPDTKEVENSKKDEIGGNGGGRENALATKRVRLTMRLLSRELKPPGTKTAIEIAVKAFEDEKLTNFPCTYWGDEADLGMKSDDGIIQRLEKGLASVSCPFM